MEKEQAAGCGPTIGAVFALCLSVKTWGWTWWALPHFFFNWFYVVYWVVFLSGWIGFPAKPNP